MGQLHWWNLLLLLLQSQLSVLFSTPEHSVPGGGEGPDEAHPDGPDGHGPDEGAREGPGDAGGPAVQPGQLLRQHPRAPAHLAGEHGQGSLSQRRPVRGEPRPAIYRVPTEVLKVLENRQVP